MPFVDHPVVAVRSPAVKVRARQVYRISVMVKMANQALPGAGGLIIRDSIGGERLQFRTPQALADDWFEVVYYRRVPEDGTLSVTLGLAGYGYASFDDFKIEPIVEQVDADQYKLTRPARSGGAGPTQDRDDPARDPDLGRGENERRSGLDRHPPPADADPPMTVDDRPILSVVIAATDSHLAVDRVLRALQGQAPGRVEVVVVAAFRLPSPRLGSLLTDATALTGVGGRHTTGGEGSQIDAEPRWPATPPVRRIIAPPGSGVPRLRWLGLEAARGRVVAFTEDSCLAETGWVDAWLAAFANPAMVAATGSVEPEEGARASILDRAVVSCEYAPFLPGNPPDAPPSRLAGNNFAVLREVALRASAGEVHEVPLLAAIRRRGGLVRTVERATVRHVRRFGWGEAFGDRLRFGLEFGRLRTVGASPLVRWAGLVAGPAIFASQVGRLIDDPSGNRRYLRPARRALPITLALLVAWSVGEWAGWSLGPRARDRPTSRRRRGTKGRTPGSPAGRAGWPPAGCTPGPPPA